jgi:hypothetical protein
MESSISEGVGHKETLEIQLREMKNAHQAAEETWKIETEQLKASHSAQLEQFANESSDQRGKFDGLNAQLSLLQQQCEELVMSYNTSTDCVLYANSWCRNKALKQL